MEMDETRRHWRIWRALTSNSGIAFLLALLVVEFAIFFLTLPEAVY